MSKQQTVAPKRWLWVGASLAATYWVGRRVKRVFVTPPTATEARVTEKERQRHVRRGLRGLE